MMKENHSEHLSVLSALCSRFVADLFVRHVIYCYGVKYTQVDCEHELTKSLLKRFFYEWSSNDARASIQLRRFIKICRTSAKTMLSAGQNEIHIHSNGLECMQNNLFFFVFLLR